jgi:hypothetical protein
MRLALLLNLPAAAVEMDPSNAQAEVALDAAMQGDLDAGIAHTHYGTNLSPSRQAAGVLRLSDGIISTA